MILLHFIIQLFQFKLNKLTLLQPNWYECKIYDAFTFRIFIAPFKGQFLAKLTIIILCKIYQKIKSVLCDGRKYAY